MPFHSASGPREGVEHPVIIDWRTVEQRARKLRAEAFAQILGAPWRWTRARIERVRAPLDFAPIGTCP